MYLCRAERITYNRFHNISRFFDVKPNIPFTTSEAMRDYYLKTWYMRVTSGFAERLKTLDLKKLRNVRKVSKLNMERSYGSRSVLYRASYLLDSKNLKVHFSFIHIYISYANTAWASTFKTKLLGILKKQKHAAQITFHANRLDHMRPLLIEMKALNIYQINLIQTLKLCTKLNMKQIHEFFSLYFVR